MFVDYSSQIVWTPRGSNISNSVYMVEKIQLAECIQALLIG